jgi:hypothetical protein
MIAALAFASSTPTNAAQPVPAGAVTQLRREMDDDPL